MPNCPLGGAPKGTCTVFTTEQQHHTNLQPAHGNGTAEARLHSCAAGWFCVTAAGSTSGHCCPVTCPLSTAVDARYSCAATVSNRCPTDTHFCHRINGAPSLCPPLLCRQNVRCAALAGPNFAFAACCKRPCEQNGPVSVYIKGVCVERGYLGGPCTRQEQCDGNTSLRCNAAGRCECRDVQHVPRTDALTEASANPAQTCARSCTQQRGRDTECLPAAALGDPCFVQEQCPVGAGCYRGRCVCRCGYARVGPARCELATTTSTTTPRPRTRLQFLHAGCLALQRTSVLFRTGCEQQPHHAWQQFSHVAQQIPEWRRAWIDSVAVAGARCLCERRPRVKTGHWVPDLCVVTSGGDHRKLEGRHGRSTTPDHPKLVSTRRPVAHPHASYHIHECAPAAAFMYRSRVPRVALVSPLDPMENADERDGNNAPPSMLVQRSQLLSPPCRPSGRRQHSAPPDASVNGAERMNELVRAFDVWAGSWLARATHDAPCPPGVCSGRARGNQRSAGRFDSPDYDTYDVRGDSDAAVQWPPVAGRRALLVPGCTAAGGECGRDVRD